MPSKTPQQKLIELIDLITKAEGKPAELKKLTLQLSDFFYENGRVLGNGEFNKELNHGFSTCNINVITALLKQGIRGVIFSTSCDEGLTKAIETENPKIIELLFSDSKVVHRANQGAFDKPIKKILLSNNYIAKESLLKTKFLTEHIQQGFYDTTISKLWQSGDKRNIDILLNLESTYSLVLSNEPSTIQQISAVVYAAKNDPKRLQELLDTKIVDEMIRAKKLDIDAIESKAPQSRKPKSVGAVAATLTSEKKIY